MDDEKSITSRTETNNPEVIQTGYAKPDDEKFVKDSRLFKIEQIVNETGYIPTTYSEQGLKNALIRAGNLIEFHGNTITIQIKQQCL